MQKIAYYITAHGYGHGTRSCDILNALHAAAPDVRLIVKTDLPAAFLRSRLDPAVELIPGAYDSGLIQRDSINVDMEASLHAVEALHVRKAELTAGEMDYIRRENIGVVVADIPAIPLAAAKRSGIPALATGNFGWDWIYEDFIELDARWQTHAEYFRAAYRETDLLLRQPFAEPMSAFPLRVDLPLLAKPGSDRRKRIAEATGADPDLQWILLSFTSLDLDAEALENMAQLRRCELFTVEPLEWPASSVIGLKRSLAGFSDILASMDVVITKPGFGIVSECIANGRPIIYTERRHFREYALLVEGIQRYCRHAFIPTEKLYAGRLEEALQAIESAPAPTEEMGCGGAVIAARYILQQLK